MSKTKTINYDDFFILVPHVMGVAYDKPEDGTQEEFLTHQDNPEAPKIRPRMGTKDFNGDKEKKVFDLQRFIKEAGTPTQMLNIGRQ